MKCLVVDDSAITRRILVNNLRTIGFKSIVEASDGKQALDVCTPDVDVVLTDWNMPGMPGVESVRSLRSHPELAPIPVLLITARNGKDDVVEAASAGVDGYIIKPFTPDVLRTKIEEALERRVQRDAAAREAAAAEAAEIAAAAAAEAAAAAAPVTAEAPEAPAAEADAEEPRTGTDG